ncbi:tyrosine-type recombinase/integrase [Undibacterium sp. Ji50W]|uniref:tyrosine-type recombinase/integrase n=1 Tax=Undibacterium sp. Ji50W TaxID=3413041 RepID=UPI003BF42290
MAKKIIQKLESLQLQHWIRAVNAGKAPTERDSVTKIVTPLVMPLARSDGGGLTFTLSISGTASWILRYRFGGRAREVTIGNYPDIGLNEARTIAREKRAKIDRGIDPALIKSKAKASAIADLTVRDLAEDYRQKVLTNLSISTQRTYSRNLSRVETSIGSYKVSQVTPIDIVSLIEKSKLPWVEANMLLCTVKMLFKHAAGRRLVAANPCIGVQISSLLGKRPAIRRRLMLSEKELLQLFNSNMSNENMLTVKILLGTAVRSGELINAKWEDFDLANGVWNVQKTKTGRAIQIPLTEAVISWLRELKILAFDSQFVLPARKEARKARNGGDAAINPNTFGEAIQYWLEEYKPDIRRFTPHDLRSTAKSHLRALGVPRDITEMCLNHKLPGVEGVYDIHTYFEERKAALTKWAAYLQKIEMS